MFKRLLFFAVTSMVSTLSASSGYASIINVGDTIRFSDGFGTTSGGEFLVHKKLGPSSYTGVLYSTFCLELNESLGFGNDYYVYDVSSQSDLGGLNVGNSANGGVGAPNPDPLDGRVAWLFQQFVKGTLANYDYGNTGNFQFASRDSSANALQRAIWYIEDELTDAQWGALSAAQQYYYNLANATTAQQRAAALGAVRVVNISLPSNSSALRQSTLQLVPEPGSALVWGLFGLSAGVFGLIRRRPRNCNS
jgi:hypothetical protein